MGRSVVILACFDGFPGFGRFWAVLGLFLGLLCATERKSISRSDLFYKPRLNYYHASTVEEIINFEHNLLCENFCIAAHFPRKHR